MFKFFNKNKYDINNDEMQICYDSSKNPIIFSEKDRFKNTLIIGPTGSGGKSLTMANMIYNDMKNNNYGMIIMEPSDDLFMKALAMAKYFNKKTEYFNPLLKTGLKFNPLNGNEKEVVERLTCAFRMLYKDAPSYILDLHEEILTRSIKVLKRLYGNCITFKGLSKFLNNIDKYGLNMMSRLESMNENCKHKENLEIIYWLRTQYFNENSNIYKDSNSLRQRISDFVSDKYLEDILTISDESDFQNTLDFEKVLRNGDILIITPNCGILRDKAKLLSYLLILQLQSVISNRKNYDTELKVNSIYIDNFQYFNNPEFLSILTTSDSNHVLFNLLIQNKDLLLDNFKTNKSYIDEFISQTSNLIIHPRINDVNATYFAKILNKYSNNTKFTTDNIMYKHFGEISYRIYRNNKFECDNGFVKYLPEDINKKLSNIQIKFCDSCRENNILKR